MKTRARANLDLRRLQTRAMVDLARIRHTSERLVDGWLREQGLDITSAQANALLVLVNARRPLSQVELATELALSEVTVGRFVRAMEEAGWVERTRDPSDARALLLRPTERARDALPRFIAVSNQLLDRVFGGLDEAEIERAVALLAAIRKNLEDDG